MDDLVHILGRRSVAYIAKCSLQYAIKQAKDDGFSPDRNCHVINENQLFIAQLMNLVPEKNLDDDSPLTGQNWTALTPSDYELLAGLRTTEQVPLVNM